MKLKYYLRGLGIGIIATTVILAISFAGREKELSDTEIIARAKELGMVMQDTEAAGSEAGEEAADTADPAAIPEEEEADMTDQTAVPEEGAPDETADGAPVVDDGSGDEWQESYFLTIQPGDVCRVVCENLASNGVISDAEALRQYLSEIGYANSMSIGIYEIPYGLTNEEIAEILKAGPIEE